MNLPSSIAFLKMVNKMATLWLLCFYFSFSDAETFYRYLNSYGNCGGQPMIVDVNDIYSLKADAQPGTATQSSLAGCEMVFRSKQEDARLCVIQDGPLNTIDDPNAELTVADGYGDKPSTFITLKYSPSKWHKREYCTTSQFITVKLHRINNNVPIAISKLHIDLKIVNIESRHRKIYMQEHYCSGDYDLDNSIVRVYNKFPSAEAMVGDSTCGVNLKKRSDEETRICLVYTPPNRLHSDYEWLFAVSNQPYSLYEKNVLYKLEWNDTRINTRHTWCASNQTSQVMLIFKRHNSSQTEPPEALGFYFADFAGTEEELLELVKSDEPSTSSDVDLRVVVAVVVVTSFAVFAVILVVVMYKKNMFRNVCHSDYVPTHNPVNNC
ncbi:uncharacterized protein LOC106053222 [Biomphalaria glabrata]|uniref:Uncharacterized protein LOC106053222 n=1 Tax=Biomphalaria glabrata TaxID=6526 RepID=A0A9W3BL20_BIOGL|nr:uncharacterized protein LOC106053222 [Biomphalaria glabrata]XP_055900117.1 uncharacterized protein LOC106053222 [Biomphalaria glabrata]XP_055900118.1 uncharacterized protein LOC106053222 [Biomphalaria glabrata]